MLTLVTVQSEQGLILDNEVLLSGDAFEALSDEHLPNDQLPNHFAKTLEKTFSQSVKVVKEDISDENLRNAGLCPCHWSWNQTAWIMDPDPIEGELHFW